MSNTLIDRRRFVQFLVASPLLGALGSLALPGQLRAAEGLRGQSIESPDRAINVFDLEAVAAPMNFRVSGYFLPTLSGVPIFW